MNLLIAIAAFLAAMFVGSFAADAFLGGLTWFGAVAAGDADISTVKEWMQVLLTFAGTSLIFLLLTWVGHTRFDAHMGENK